MTQRWPEPTEDKHIPGPWEVRYVSAKWNVICPVGYVTRIAEQCFDTELTPRDYANARLLAATTDLLEAAKGAVAALTQPGHHEADRAAAVTWLSAAIAKATGGAA